MSTVRINEFEAIDGRREELRGVLESVVPIIRASAGCVSCQLLESDDQPRRFVVIETWATRDAHQLAASKIPADLLRRAMTLVADVPRGAYYRDVP